MQSPLFILIRIELLNMFGLWGIIFGSLSILFGIFSIFFFPSSLTHQERDISLGGVILGVIALIVGAILVFW
jgi:hypothetical protein